jgi:hypothetical protein
MVKHLLDGINISGETSESQPQPQPQPQSQSDVISDETKEHENKQNTFIGWFVYMSMLINQLFKDVGLKFRQIRLCFQRCTEYFHKNCSPKFPRGK